MEGRIKGRGPQTLLFFLYLLSHLFEVLVQFRLRFYGWGVFKHQPLGCQVISVGNLTVGGTGKTPIVEIFARMLNKSGRKVAILSRGYKRKGPSFWEKIIKKLTFDNNGQKPLVVSDGRRLLLDSATSGDEPYMLASNLPGVAVIVGKNRVRSGQYAIHKLGCDILILDDGFQYLDLKHRLDVVLVDQTNPFGNQYVLPRGILREPVRNIKRAGFIFITKCRERENEELKKRLRELNPEAEISECRHCSRYIRNVFTGATLDLDYLRGKKVTAISGIAVPKGFEEEVERQGAEVLYHKTYADHHRYTQQEILDLINYSITLGVDAIITTEKDAVRFPKLERRDVPIFYLRVEIEMLSGADAFNEWISKISFQQYRKKTEPNDAVAAVTAIE